MSTTVDQRVVEMQFDNEHFESNVQTTLSTLDKLKQSLNLTGAAKGLENIDSAAKRCNLAPLNTAVETVQAKFSAMQVMAVTALANITNSAVNAGRRIVSALTIDPIKTGFQEYETQINAVQTILSNTRSKGTTLEDVNGALDELNTYADKTIYNFTEMTRNIGTFTAAGVDLDKSVSSIKGIANLAAVSGSTSQQASTAMYQLSQALAAGKVSLMDWNSVVNAGMGGQVFQDALKRTATNMGTDVDAMIKKYGSFRESLTKGEWLTAEVLTETLSQLAGAYSEADLLAKGYTESQAKEILALAEDAENAATKVKTFTQLWDTLKESAQSGWTQTWEIIVGDFEEARELLTNVSNILGDMIGKSAEARNTLLQGWKDAGGRKDLIEGFKNAFNGVLAVITPIKEAFRDMFPPLTVDQLVKFTEGFKNLTKSFEEFADSHGDQIYSTFKGLFAILDIVAQAVSAVVKAIFPMFDGVGSLAGGFLDVTAAIGDWLVKLDESIKKSGFFVKVSEGIAGAIKFVIDVVKSFVDTISELDIFDGVLESIRTRMSQVGEAADGLGSGIGNAFKTIGDSLANSKFVEALRSLWDGIKNIAGALGDGLISIIQALGDALGGANFSAVLDIFNSAALGGIVVMLGKFAKNFTDIFDVFGGVGDVLENASGVLEGVKDTMKAYQNQLNAEALVKIATAIAILAGSILVISLIDSEKLSASLGAITMLFADLMGSLAIFARLTPMITDVAKAIGAMIGISVAVLILASALKKIGSLDSDQMIVGLVGVTGLLIGVVGSMAALSKYADGGIKGAFSMVIFAGAIVILGSVLKSISSLGWEGIAKGLVGVVSIAGTLVLASIAMSKFSDGGIKGALSMVIFAGAIAILTAVLKSIADMGLKQIAKGLGGVVSLAATLVLASVAMSKFSDGGIKGALSMVIFAGAIAILGQVLKGVGSLGWKQIAKGLGGIIGVTVTLVAASVAMSKFSSGGIAGALSMVIFAGAITIMAEALGQMGNMSWESIAKGLVALGGAMLILAVGLNAMNGTLVGSAALIVAAGAISILTPALKTLGDLSWESIAKGLITLAGAFAVIGIAGALLAPLVPAILGLGAAFALIGVGVLGLGAGLSLVGVSLSVIAVGLTALASAIVGSATAITAGVTVIVMGIVNLIPAIAQKIGEAIITLCNVITEGAPAIGEAVKAVVLTLVDVLVECVPAISEGALALLLGVLDALVQYTPQIVEGLFNFLINILKSLSAKVPELIVTATEFIMSIFKGVIDAIKGIDTGVLIQGLLGVGLLAGIMMALSAVVSLIPGAMTGVLGMGAVIAELALVLGAIGLLAQIPGLDWLINEGAGLLKSIGNAIGSFIGGIIGGVAAGVTSQLPQMGSDLAKFMTNIKPFIEGAKSLDASMMDGVRALADAILVLTAADILDGLTSWITGGSSLTSFAEQLVPFGTAMKNYGAAIAGVDTTAILMSAQAARALVSVAEAIPAEGGFWQLIAGEKNLGSFGAKLVPFAQGMKSYSIAVAGINTEAIVSSASAAKALVSVANAIPPEGGFWQLLAGEKNLGSFGQKLVPFATGMKMYSSAVAGINSASIVASIPAAQALVAVADTIPPEGGFWQLLAGEKNLASFGQKLVPFGMGLKMYAAAVVGLDATTILASVAAAKGLVEVANAIPPEGGFWSLIEGKKDLATFGEKLAPFGKSVKAYSNAVAGLDVGSASASVPAAKAMVSVAKAIPKDLAVKANSDSISTFGTRMVAFGKSLKSYSASVAGLNAGSIEASAKAGKSLVSFIKSLSGVGTGGVSSFVTAVNTLGTAKVKEFVNAFKGATGQMSAAGANLMKAFVKGVTSSQGQLTSTVTSTVSKMTKAFSDKKATFTTLGKTLMTNFIKGFKQNISSIKTAVTSGISSAVSAISSYYSRFHTAGTYLGSGFVSGVASKQQAAYRAGYNLGKAAAQGVKDGEDAHSPSREGEKAGIYLGEGVIVGVKKMGKAVYSAGYNLGQTAAKSLSNAVSKISDVINSDMDTQPTIRPVLDLSNIQAGAGAINNMLGGNVLATVGGINASMNRRIQNGANDDVVSAINKLRKDVGNLENRSYSVGDITYSHGDEVSSAIETLVRAARVEGRA